MKLYLQKNIHNWNTQGQLPSQTFPRDRALVTSEEKDKCKDFIDYLSQLGHAGKINSIQCCQQAWQFFFSKDI